MIPKDQVRRALQKLFQKRPVVTINDLYTCLHTRSRMTCFRRLRELGYQSSFSHSGKFYTLSTIPHYDVHGLWYFEGIGFSRSGSLKNTISELVEKSFCGFTHGHLEKLLQVRMYNTLLDLVRHSRVRRERFGSTFVYLSADNDKAKEQVAYLQKQRLSPAQGRLPDWVIIEVLASVIRCGDFLPEPGQVLSDLHSRGHCISLGEIEQTFEQCNFKKNF